MEATGARKSMSTGPPQPASLKKLKSDLKDALKHSGVLDTVKAQIRKEFISSLATSGKIGQVLQSVDDAGNVVKLGSVRRVDLKTRLALSATYHLLRKRGMVHSLSVFAAESGLDSKTALLTETDIVSSLNVNGSSPLHKAIVQAAKISGAESSSGAGKENASTVAPSVIELMFEHCFSMAQKGGRDSSVQTDTKVLGGETPREALDSTLRDLRSTLARRLDAERLNPSRGVEERMHAYQRECDERVRREVEIQMEVFRDSEIGRIRLQESQRARTELQSLRNEMEAEYNRRAQSNSAREAEAARANAERERKAQLAGYESRQQLQRELDEMRAREQVSLSLLLSPLSLCLSLSLSISKKQTF